MRDDDRVELTPAERDALAGLGSDWTAPAALRDRITGTARARGLFGGAARYSRRTLWTSVAAAAAMAFSAGTWIGAASRRRMAPGPDSPAAGGDVVQNHYLLFLHEGRAYDRPADPAAHAVRAREYGDWMRSLQRAGRLAGGDELAADGHWLRRDGDQIALLPLTPDSEHGLIDGYFRIAAANDEDAVAVARDCPHLRHGGTVEIRRVVQ